MMEDSCAQLRVDRSFLEGNVSNTGEDEKEYDPSAHSSSSSDRWMLYVAAVCVLVVLLTNLTLLHVLFLSQSNKVLITEAEQKHDLYSKWLEQEARMRFLEKRSREPSHIEREAGARKSVKFISEPEYYSNCSDLWSHLEKLQYVSHGWTKAVYSAVYRGQPVAAKTINFEGYDMISCRKPLASGSDSTPAVDGTSAQLCYAQSAAKMLKEISLLKALSHPHILKVVAYCVPRDSFARVETANLLVMVTSLGEPIDLIKLLQMVWEDRLKMALDLAHILDYISTSPVGNFRLNDFRKEQFVLINKSLVLSDVDDTSLGSQNCNDLSACHSDVESVNTHDHEKHNLRSAALHFLDVLLSHGAPRSMKMRTQEIIGSCKQGNISSAELLARMVDYVQYFSSGQHLQLAANSLSNYHFRPETDLEGMFDYQCAFSVSPVCSLTAHNQSEAAALCDLEPSCQAFVLSTHRSWTGRYFVYLKNGFSSNSTSSNRETTLYYKQRSA